MTTVHAQLVGDKVLLPRDDLERLMQLARRSEEIDLQVQEDDWPTLGMMRLAEQGGAFRFWLDPGEDIYTSGDGEPV